MCLVCGTFMSEIFNLAEKNRLVFNIFVCLFEDFFISRIQLVITIIINNMLRKTKRRGVGAKVSVNTTYLYPHELVDAIPELANARKVKDLLLVIDREMRSVRHSEPKMCILMRHPHPKLENATLYCIQKYAAVDEKGPAESLFDIPVQPADGNGNGNGDDSQEEKTRVLAVGLQDLMLIPILMQIL